MFHGKCHFRDANGTSLSGMIRVPNEARKRAEEECDGASFYLQKGRSCQHGNCVSGAWGLCPFYGRMNFYIIWVLIRRKRAHL